MRVKSKIAIYQNPELSVINHRVYRVCDGKEIDKYCVVCGNFDESQFKYSYRICDECYGYHDKLRDNTVDNCKQNHSSKLRNNNPLPYNSGFRNGKKGYIYFIRSHDNIKIGRSKSLESRFKQIKAMNVDAELLFAIKTSDMNYFESSLHDRFAERHVLYEWFNLDENDLNEVKRKYKKDIVYLKL